MKTIKNFAKVAIALIAMMAVCAPCLLTFSVGDDGNLTVWNFVGLAYSAMLYKGAKKVSRVSSERR